MVPQKKSDTLRNILTHLFSSLPLQCAYYQSPKMKMHSAREVWRKEYDIVHLQLARMMPYAIQWKHAPVIVDFVDTLSLNMRRRLEREKLVLKPLLFYEWYKMKSYEAKLDDHFNGAVISSPVDRDALPYGESVEVVPNGVDVDYFRYFSTSQREPRTIIFTGNMGYFPNVDAVTYFCREIYPQVKRDFPEVKFRIVGYSPKTVVSKLSKFNKSIEVTGFVDNIANELGKASIAVAPMQSGSGVQNKILEAMATGTPVVASQLATRAIDLEADRDIIIADCPVEFARAVVRLLNDRVLRHALGLNGRKLVEQKYSWPRVVRKLENIYQETIENFNE